MDPVKLIASDGSEIIIDRRAALVSGTIKSMLAGPGSRPQQRVEARPSPPSAPSTPPPARRVRSRPPSTPASCASSFAFAHSPLPPCASALSLAHSPLHLLRVRVRSRQGNSRSRSRARSNSQRSAPRCSRRPFNTFTTSSSTPTTRDRCPSSRSSPSRRSSCSWRPTFSTLESGRCRRALQCARFDARSGTATHARVASPSPVFIEAVEEIF
jgi:hypothetical protein